MKADKHIELVPIEHNQTVCSECSIRRLALFHGVTEEDLMWTQKYRRSQFTVSARKEIFKELVPSEYMFTLYHGWVASYKTLNTGKRQILRISLPGDMLGFQADLIAPMTHSAVSLSAVVLCAFPRAEMPELLRRNLSVAKRLSELNARDMNICQNRLMTFGQQSAIERIAFFCAELYYRALSIFGSIKNDEMFFPLSQEDIGDATGLTKIHVNRTLKALREQGYMEVSSKHLKIHDVKGLCELGSFDPEIVTVHKLY